MSVSRVAIALGSNLGDRWSNLDSAVEFLKSKGTHVKVSSYYETAPVDCPDDAGAFLNASVSLDYEGSVTHLLQECLSFELGKGRSQNRIRNASRTLDFDILLVDNQIIQEPDLQVPHPRMLQRLFVMVPLAEIAPDWIIPTTGKTVQFHLQDLLRNSKAEELCHTIE